MSQRKPSSALALATSDRRGGSSKSLASTSGGEPLRNVRWPNDSRTVHATLHIRPEEDVERRRKASQEVRRTKEGRTPGMQAFVRQPGVTLGGKRWSSTLVALASPGR